MKCVFAIFSLFRPALSLHFSAQLASLHHTLPVWELSVVLILAALGNYFSLFDHFYPTEVLVLGFVLSDAEVGCLLCLRGVISKVFSVHR